MPTPVVKYLLSSTQAGGAVAVSTDIDGFIARGHQRYSIQAEVTNTATGEPAVATAGTLSVRGRVKGATQYQELGVVNLVAPNIAVFTAYLGDIEAESIGFDADKTWKLHIVAGG